MHFFRLILILFVVLSFAACGSGETDEEENNGNGTEDMTTLLSQVDTSSPATTVKICFIHHSTGSQWISTSGGGLGAALNANNYYATETDYGWDATNGDNIGSSTDTEDWPDWFTDTIMPYVYDNDAHYDYPTNSIDDPGGENQIIMFKSCYPCSEVGDSIDDEKAIYLGLLDYFEDHQDKLFILVVPPPEITINSNTLTRELANWLVDYENGWLSGYPYFNVQPFDYYNVLTDPNNHHMVEGESVVHVISSNPVDAGNPNELYYYTGTNNHPTNEGHQKATEEFLPLLNAYYNLWRQYR
jgi:hypothetical protein